MTNHERSRVESSQWITKETSLYLRTSLFSHCTNSRVFVIDCFGLNFEFREDSGLGNTILYVLSVSFFSRKGVRNCNKKFNVCRRRVTYYEVGIYTGTGSESVTHLWISSIVSESKQITSRQFVSLGTRRVTVRLSKDCSGVHSTTTTRLLV